MTLEERLAEALKQQGILAYALDDCVRGGVAQFALPPSDAEVATWAHVQKTSKPLYFAQAAPLPPRADEQERQRILDKLSAEEKLTRARAAGLHSPVQRRFARQDMPADERARLGIDQMTPTQKLTADRQWQAQQQGKG